MRSYTRHTCVCVHTYDMHMHACMRTYIQVVLAVSRSVDESPTSGSAVLQALLMVLGPRCLVLLAPDRHLRFKFKCVFASQARTFSAMGFILTDLLLICARHKGSRT